MRTLRPTLFVLLLVLLTAGPAAAARGTSPFLDYRHQSWFLPQTPGVTGGPVGGLFNPAAYALNDVGGADFWWDDADLRSGLDNYGFALGRTLHFGMNTTTYGTSAESFQVYDYQLGLAAGSRDHTFGLGYRWSHGETDRVARQKALALGTVSRPRDWLSFGSSAVLSLESAAAQVVFDLGIRPFGSEFVTVFADWTANDDERFFADGTWGAGLEVRPVAGLHLGARAREGGPGRDPDFSLLGGVTVGFTGAAVMPRYDGGGDLRRTHYLLRSTPPMRGLPAPGLILGRHETYFPLSLENKRLTYQKYRYFDDKRIAWLDLLPLLNAVRDDADLDILVVNLAGFSARPSLVWEFRQKLLEIRAAGKEVIVHTDNSDARTYYLASAADRVTIDPYGMIAIPGNALSRSYLKGTLEKLGLGFQEHRYFKYKSAAETLSRDSMSDADREQRQRIVDVIYETLRDGMAAGRHLAPATVDGVIDAKGLLTAHEAVAAGLVDGIMRWDGLLKNLQGERGARPATTRLAEYRRRFWDERWGRPATIPVVYAVGPCAMDEGIKGRATSEYLRGLVGDPSVKAVVLRADSPGGEPLPSDLIAEAVRALRAAGKPVIVSQGDVAASGGYWISMDGTEILTTPLTVTGSVGVISGWLWDDGFAEKLGVTSDLVRRGEHADLYATVNLPFLGGIPRRPMNPGELDRVEVVIRDMYGRFVDAVAAGRGMDREAVHAIAQGRVWMGGDAIANGLVDRFGGLDEAIATARARAGIPDGREVRIVEFPPRPLFRWPSLGPKLPGLFGLGELVNRQLAALYGEGDGGDGGDPAVAAAVPVVGAPGLAPADVQYLRALTRTLGGAALLTAPDLLPPGWQDPD